MTTHYIGDGVYVDMDLKAMELTLWTERERPSTKHYIVLSPYEIGALLELIEVMRITREKRAQS